MKRSLVSFLTILVAGFLSAGVCQANSSEAGTTPAAAPQQGAVPMNAELIKRSDGSWVIAKLSTAENLEPTDSELSEHPGLQATFDGYRRALARGDMEQLSSVWVMNPAERQELERLASNQSRISISISDATFVVNGDRATVQFLQRKAQSPVARKARRKLSRRGMAAYDSASSWDDVTTR